MPRSGKGKVERKELELIKGFVQRYIGCTHVPSELETQVENLIPLEQQENMDALLSGRLGRGSRSGLSYRDGVLIQLAFKLCSMDEVVVTRRPAGARTVAGKLGRFFQNLHIPAVPDAYQNIAKNSADLVRGNVPQWDSFLSWADGASEEELRVAFEYACAVVATQARPVPPMPELDATRLRFAGVMRLYDSLLSRGSQGVFEQYIVASLLYALFHYESSGYRVETKKVNASDAASRAAGDVELYTGSKLLEALEITAAGWQEKLAAARRKIKDHDLPRMHVLAPLRADDYPAMLLELQDIAEDISVLDLRSSIAFLVAALTKPNRKAALHRLYELLERFEEDIDLVRTYVEALYDQGLTLNQ